MASGGRRRKASSVMARIFKTSRVTESHEDSSLLQTAIKILRRQYPHGSPYFITNLVEKMELHSRKNYDYAAGGHPLGNFHRVSLILAHYPSLTLSDPRVITLIYMLKQLDAILWILNTKHSASEPLSARAGDITVYSTIVELLDSELRGVTHETPHSLDSGSNPGNARATANRRTAAKFKLDG